MSCPLACAPSGQARDFRQILSCPLACAKTTGDSGATSATHTEADKVRQRKRLAAPHFAKEEVPEEPKEITDFFKNFAKTSEADKIA